MKTKMNIGFVGTGRHARRSIYPSLRWAPIDLVAVCDRHGGEVLGDTARKFGAKRTYTNYRKMFEEEDLDAAIIVIGPDSHPQISIDAMRAGLHVFIEKPPANTVKEAMEMAEVARALMTALPTDQYIGTNEEAPLVWKPAFSLSTAVRVPVLEGFVGEIQHFAESILKGEPPSSNIDDGIEALKLVYAMYSKPGKTIYLDEI